MTGIDKNFANTAAAWLAQNAQDQASVYQRRPDLVRALWQSTGASVADVEAALGRDWSAIIQRWRSMRSDASSTVRKAPSGGAAARAAADKFLAEQIAGVRIRPDVDFSGLSERVLARTHATDAKGRPYGTPRNPVAVAPLDAFKPRLAEVKAASLESLIKERKHGIHPAQAESVAQLSNEELVRFRPEDPMSAIVKDGGFSLTGGHHRTNEIIERVKAGRLPADAVVEVLLHE